MSSKSHNPQSQKILKPPHPTNSNTPSIEKSPFSISPNIVNLQKNRPCTASKARSTTFIKPQSEPSDNPAKSTRIIPPHSKSSTSMTSKSTNQTSNNESNDDLTDEFISLTINNPLNVAIETFLKPLFKASNILYWEEIPSLQSLFSSTYNTVIPNSSGLIGYSLFSDRPILLSEPQTHPSFYGPMDKELFNLGSPTALIPLTDFRASKYGVVQIQRSLHSSDFNQDDLETILWFSKKFQLLSRFILSPTPILHLNRVVLKFGEVLKKVFLN